MADPDRSLWRRATRDVAPLKPRAAPPVPKPAAVPSASEPPRLRPALAEPTPPTTLARFAGIDRANAERLKRGKHRIEARLDLHGMTQAEAHRVLLGFIRAARADGKRCVLVITGRGSPRGHDSVGGVLKAAVPRWLDEPEFRPHLLAIAAAQPKDGGAGALYVMLRRNAAA
jgi:DNA-nicking Smr family endonuclease